MYIPFQNETVPISRKDELIREFTKHLISDLRKNRSVKYYADKLYITPKHLFKILKDTSGQTAREWIDSYVILEAKSQLKSTNLTIQQISDNLNFANQSFFGKYFKLHTGISPSEYRNKI